MSIPVAGGNDLTEIPAELQAAFRSLDRGRISWVLLRGRADLAERGGDVDLLVSRPAASALEALRSAGFREVPGRGRAPHRFSCLPTSLAAAEPYLTLDIVDRVVFGPWQQLPSDWSEAVLSRRQERGGVWQPEARDAAWLELLHQVLDKRHVGERAQRLAAGASTSDPLARALDAQCGKGTATWLLEVVAAGDPDAWRELQRRWSSRPLSLARSARSRSLRVVHDGGRFSWRDGRTVAVLGPDGAGKSTLIDALVQVPMPVRMSRVYFGLWRENAWDERLSPVLGAQFALRVGRAVRQSARARAARARGHLVLLDRSPYDALTGEAADSWPGRLLSRIGLGLAPHPDVVLVLDAPAAVMYARKGEDTPELLESRRRGYLALRDRIPHVVVLDAAAPAEQVHGAALAAIWELMAAPGRRRARPGNLSLPRTFGSPALEEDPLRLWRRLDWQFLLSSPLAQRVSVLGTPDADVLQALDELAERGYHHAVSAELLVLVQPGLGELRRAVRAAAPGSEVYVEITGWRSLASWARLVGRAGVDVRGVHWHVGSRGRATRTVPLTSTPALLDTLGRYDALRFGRARWVVGRALLACGLLPRVVRDGSITGVVGSAPWASEDALAMLMRSAADAYRGSDQLDVVLVTPSDATSRHVVALGFQAGSRVPVVVAKIPRRVGDLDGIAREAGLLPRLVSLVPELASAVPRVLGVYPLGDHHVLLMTGLPGRPMNPPWVRRHPAAALRAGLAFVSSLPTTAGITDASWWAQHLVAPLSALGKRAAELSPELLEQTLLLLAPLTQVALPTVFEHGDLSDPNLLIGGDEGLQVLDWERALAHGLPTHDLIQLLTYLGDARADARSAEDKVVAYEQAFCGKSAWARPHLNAYLRARGISEDLRPALLLACWARASASLVTRLSYPAEVGARAVEPDLSRVASAEPDVARWRCSLERFAEL